LNCDVKLFLFFSLITCPVLGQVTTLNLCLKIGVHYRRIPGYAAQLTCQTLGLALVMVMIIAAVSSYIGVRKVLQIQPFDIFRG
jgi:putative ABC transport system permease protein